MALITMSDFRTDGGILTQTFSEGPFKKYFKLSFFHSTCLVLYAWATINDSSIDVIGDVSIVQVFYHRILQLTLSCISGYQKVMTGVQKAGSKMGGKTCQDEPCKENLQAHPRYFQR